MTALCQWYIGKVIKDWLQVTKQNILAKDLNITLFVDEQMIMSSTCVNMVMNFWVSCKVGNFLIS
jgi:hypothetical protein